MADSEMVASGLQGVERTALVLRAVASKTRDGARLTDVVEATGLSKTTTHRMLQALVSAGLIEHHGASGLFYLGLELVSLGFLAANRHDLIDLISPAMARLAERTGDTVYFNIRDRFSGVCVDRAEGSFPIKTLTLDRGDRRPLGVGAGNLAILAFLGDAEVREALDINASAIPTFGELDAASMLELVAQTRTQGYAFNEGRIVQGMSAVGVPIMATDMKPIAALSVAAVTERMRPERRGNIVSWLTTEARNVEKDLERMVGRVTGPSVQGLLRRNRSRGNA